MYAAHFGLREPPFAITPDPAYVYLSRHHREALAHLLYGTGENGGFVQLTGEVGSGGCGVTQAELAGKYYRVLDRIEVRENGARIYCEPTGKGSSGDPSGHLDFGWQPGDSPILTWQR